MSRPLPESPFVVAYGMGVDSTAMLVGLADRGVRPDLILFADTGGEKPETYDYLPAIQAFLARVGFPAVEVVRYRTRPTTGYDSLEGECLKNQVLPGLVFGRGSCSSKWKQDAQLQRLRSWEPGIAARAAGRSVLRAIGYDSGAADGKRACAAGENGSGSSRAGAGLWAKTDRFQNWYPLRLWGWDRPRCEREILRAGLPVPPKSACYFCPASRPEEIAALGRDHPELLRRALALEANARTGKHRVGARGSIQGLAFKKTWAEIAAAQGFSVEPEPAPLAASAGIASIS